MAIKNTLQIRVINGGKFHELIKLIEDQFQQKHGFSPTQKDLCEVIARAVMDAKLF